MKLLAVSNVYAQPEIVASSIARFFLTAGVIPSNWTLVDNHWPMIQNPAWFAMKAAELIGLAYCIPATETGHDGIPMDKNLGGHGGTTFGLKHLKFEDDDLILNYDLDSWPITPGWLTAMVETMQADPTLGWVALMVNRLISDPKWTYETIGGNRVAFRTPTEMWNVSLFRGKMFRQGMLADSRYYGYVESAMERLAQSLGLRHGWMADFIEGDHHPISHPREFCDYKDEHARSAVRFQGSFEEYLKLKGGVI